MFTRSAAADTLQGQAIQQINSRWGKDTRSWVGRETIGIPVCKNKYSPFLFVKNTAKTSSGKTNVNITVQRMYGCHCHSDARKRVIEQYGVREGWEPFGQWSLSKAKAICKKVVDKDNKCKKDASDEVDGIIKTTISNSSVKTICNNGICVWKIKGKYDDIICELLTESGVLKDDKA